MPLSLSSKQLRSDGLCINRLPVFKACIFPKASQLQKYLMKNYILEEDLMESCYFKVLENALVLAIGIFFKHLYAIGCLRYINTLPTFVAKMGIIWYNLNTFKENMTSVHKMYPWDHLPTLIAKPTSVKFHRILEWFWLERPLKIISFQPLWNGKGHFPLDLFKAPSSLNPIEHFRGWAFHSFSGQTVPPSSW